MKAIIGRKVGMSQIFDEKGHVIPVTVIEAGPCVVTQKKTSEKDGYEAVQLGYEDIREAKLSKPELGHLNKAGVSPKKYLREFDLDNASELELGSVVKVKLTQVLLGGNASLVQVAEFRLGELRFANVLVAKLDSLITVFFAGLLLSDHAGTGLDNGDRDHMALFVEDLRHANFSADDCFHV